LLNFLFKKIKNLLVGYNLKKGVPTISTMVPTVSDSPSIAASIEPSHTATVSNGPSMTPTPLQEEEEDDDAECVDTVGDFPNWTGFGRARDCDYVEESWTRIK
jgi:hypothetical protein